MAYTYTDITGSGVRLIAKDGRITFDGPGISARFPLKGDPQEAPTNGLFCRAVDVAGLCVGIAKGQDGPHKDRALVFNSFGTVRDLGPSHGVQSVGVTVQDHALRAVFAENGSTLTFATLNPVTLEVVEREMKPIPTGSQGFIDLNPVKTSDEHRTEDLAGVRFFYPLRRGDWTVGNTHDNRVVVHRHSTGENFLAWGGDTQVPPRINAAGVVAVSAEDGGDPASLFITPDRFQLLQPDQPDDPDEPDEPDDPEDPMPGPQPASLLPQIEHYRGSSPTMGHDALVALLNRVLWESPDKGWRLFGKSPGQAGGTRYDGVRVSHDFLVHTSGWCVDAFGDGGGASRPQWDIRLQKHEDGEDDVDRWVAPIKPQEVPDEPDEPEEPDEPDPDAGKVLERLSAIEKAVTDLTGAVEALRQAQTQALGGVRSDVREIGALAQTAAAAAEKAATRPFPPYSGRVGLSLRLLPEVPK